MENFVSYPSEDTVVIPREIAETNDLEQRVIWLREHNKNGVFAFEPGTEHIEKCIEGYADPEDDDYELLACLIEKIYIPDSVTTIGTSAFQDCKALSWAVIPDSVTAVCDYAFAACGALNGITIPDSVTEIGYCAFNGCESITELRISEQVTCIRDWTFARCKSLTGTITLPRSVKAVSCRAFDRRNNISAIRLPADCVIYYNDNNMQSEMEKFMCDTEIIRY